MRRVAALLVAPARALARLLVAVFALLSARSASGEGVTSGSMEVEDRTRAAEADGTDGGGRTEAAPRRPPEDVGSARSLPDADTARRILERMMLIRRFEERAGEMYAKAKIGGFLHLCIGEEATIVVAVEAMRDGDYLLSTYREHGQAIARGTSPNAVMAELFGRVDGCSKGRGGSMHLFDYERRFLGGYGIVGGNLPLAAGVALACDYRETEDAVLCMLGDGASNQGTFGETMNLAALWSLPIVFLVVNNQFGMGTALERHSAVTDLSRKSEGFGVPGSRCNGMDVLDVYPAVCAALRCAREERRPQLVEAVTYRYRDVHPGEQERDAPEVSRELAEAGAAYANVGDAQERRRQRSGGDGEGEPAADERDEGGGGD